MTISERQNIYYERTLPVEFETWISTRYRIRLPKNVYGIIGGQLYHILISNLTDFSTNLQGVDLRNPYAKVLPPIRSRAIRSRLVKLFMKGYIPIIATDHAPHAPKEKRGFVEALPGISSIQHFLAILYSLSKKFHIDFRGVIRRVTEAPARIFGLPYRGKIKVGEWANLVLFNHKRKFMVDPEYSLSKAKYSLYDGMVLQGKVESVILRGNLVYHKGIFLRRIGRYIFNL